MLKKAIETKKYINIEHYTKPYRPKSDIEKSLEKTLDKNIDTKYKDLVLLKKRMTKYKDYLFTFLHHFKVPPDGSERAIRNVKVKQKVSGQFKTQRGAEIYAIIRSITDTCIKNSQNVLSAFENSISKCDD
jgi:transposase